MWLLCYYKCFSPPREKSLLNLPAQLSFEGVAYLQRDKRHLFRKTIELRSSRVLFPEADSSQKR